MKKIRKRLLSLVLLFTMILTIFTGCGNSGGDGGDDGEKKDGYKIGVVIWSTDDATTAPMKRWLDYYGSELGYTFEYKTGDFDGESQLAAVENFIAAGVDGIMICPLVEASIENIYQACEDAQVPYVQMFRGINDEKLAEEMKSKEYFLGWVHEDDVAAGYHMVELLAEQGAENFAGVYMGPGNQATDDRQAGMEQAFEEGIGNKVAEYILPMGSSDSTLWTQAATNFYNQYGDGIDAIVSSVGSNGGSDALIAVMESTKAGYKLGEFDCPTATMHGFENDYLHVVANGMMADPLLAFVILANYLEGTPLCESDEAVCIDAQYMWITSAEEQELYETYVDKEGVYAYSVDEVKDMLQSNNPDFTAESLQEVADNWTLDNVVSKNQ